MKYSNTYSIIWFNGIKVQNSYSRERERERESVPEPANLGLMGLPCLR
jgi:hypothetical protein